MSTTNTATTANAIYYCCCFRGRCIVRAVLVYLVFTGNAFEMYHIMERKTDRVQESQRVGEANFAIKTNLQPVPGAP